MTTRAPAAPPRRHVRRRALALLLIGTAVVHTTMFLSKPIVSYRVLALGGDEIDVGVVAAASALLPIFLAIPMGRFSDRGRVPILLVSGAIVLIAGPLGLANVESILGVGLVNAAYGFGLLALMVAGQAVVVALSGPGERDRNFGWFTASASLGQMLGPLLGGWVMGASSGPLLADTTAAFLTGSGVAVGALLAYGLVVVVLRGSAAFGPSVSETSRADGTAGASNSASDSAGRGSALALLRNRQLAVAVFVSFAFISGVDLLIAYLPVFGEHAGLSPSLVGTMLAIRAGLSFITRLFLDSLVRLAGRLVVIVVSAAVATATMLAIVVSSGPFMLGALMVLLGLTLGLGQPLTMTWVVEQAPQRLRATALALRITGNRVAQTTAPALAGGLSSLIGVAGPFVLAALLLGAAGASVVPFLRSR
ncbi:MFS transporter [Haloechinothrix halophila]|uniref:MFS transporter n=1 Tax=Haloechinothrix halophila TaxID=1069073 RepID=UPI0012F7959A|nr:MFS transporter [Haloechinothrix halophila]